MTIDSNNYEEKQNRRKEEKIGRIYNALIKYSEHEYWRKGYKLFIESLLKRERSDISSRIFQNADYSDIGVKLLRSASCKNFEFFQLLLMHGADFTRKDEQGRTIIQALLEDVGFGRFQRNPLGLMSAILDAQIMLKITSNPSGNNGITHFHAACVRDNVQAVEFFLNNGVDVNDAVSVDSPYFAGFTALHLAVKYKITNVLRILLEHGANIHLTNAAGLSPLHKVVKAKLMEELDREVVLMYDTILKDFIDIAMNDAKTVADDVGFCHLHAACILQDESLVENILDKIDNVNRALNLDSPICPGYTSLHFAVFCHNFRIFELLLEKGADIRIKNARGLTALDLMCLHNLRQIHSVISTIDEWRSIVLSDDQTKLMDVVSAMESKDKFVVFLNNQNIIDSSVCVPLNSTLWPGYTVLHIAVMLAQKLDYRHFFKQHDSDVIEECLKRGADVTIKDAKGSTPIHLAFDKRKSDVVRLLLNHHYEYTDNPVNQNNLSHFHIACMIGHQKMVEHFLSNGVDVNSSGPTTFTSLGMRTLIPANSTALHFSVCFESSRGLIPKLLEHGADINAKDANGFTLVHLLLMNYGGTQNQNELLSNERLENSTTYYGNLTYLHVACHYRHVSCAEKLLKNGADPNAALTYEGHYPRDEDVCTYYYGLSPSREDNDFSLSRFLPTRCVGYTPLDYLWVDNSRRSVEDKVKITFLLIEHNVDITARVEKGTSPLERLLSLPYYFHECYKTFSENATIKTRLKRELGITELHLACYLADYQLVEGFIYSGVNVNPRVNSDSPIWRGYTPLHCTVQRAVEKLNDEKNFDCDFHDRLSEVVGLLMKHGADLLLTDEEGANTPLHLINLDYNADKLRQVSPFIWSFFENLKDFSVNPTNLEGISLFHIACATQHEATIETFLKQGSIDVNRAISYLGKIWPGSTALHLLIKYDLPRDDSNDHAALLRMVDMLLDNHADINAQDAFGNTPLLEATQLSGSIRAVLIKKLLSIGADVHVENVKGMTAFELLLATSDQPTWEEIELFLNAGYHFHMYNSITEEGCLAKALRSHSRSDADILNNQNFMKVFDYLDKTGMTNTDGRTVLHNLVSIDFDDRIFGHVRSYETSETGTEAYTQLIGWLLMRGYDIDQQDNEGQTALHLAIIFDNTPGIIGLLNNGADVNVTDNNGKTVFVYFSGSDSVYWKEYNYGTANFLIRHVKKLEFCGQRVSEQKKVLETEFERCLYTEHQRIKLCDDFYQEIERSKNMKIGTTCILSVYDFLTSTDMDMVYKNMTMDERREVDQFIAKIDEYQFTQIGCILKLMYRQTIERISLLEPALKSLNALIKWYLPDLCCRYIMSYLKNNDLKRLIAASIP